MRRTAVSDLHCSKGRPRASRVIGENTGCADCQRGVRVRGVTVVIGHRRAIHEGGSGDKVARSRSLSGDILYGIKFGANEFANHLVCGGGYFKKRLLKAVFPKNGCGGLCV